jgi:hypothetical protein
MRPLLQRHFDDTAAERRALGIDALAPDEELMDAGSFASLYDPKRGLEKAAADITPATAPRPPVLRTPAAPSAPSLSEDLDALARASGS